MRSGRTEAVRPPGAGRRGPKTAAFEVAARADLARIGAFQAELVRRIVSAA
jgi:hypothetical protein